MKIEDLKTKIDSYKESQELIENNRKTWQEKTKVLLLETLNKIKDSYPINWHIQNFKWKENLEVVNITFGPTPSGIMDINEKLSKPYMKRGGTLAFSQAIDGDVYVIIVYPSIEDILSDSGNKIIGKYSPNLISESFIIEKVSKFIDEIVIWEKSSYGNPIGFKFD